MEGIEGPVRAPQRLEAATRLLFVQFVQVADKVGTAGEAVQAHRPNAISRSESNLDIGVVLGMDGVDEADLMRERRHQKGLGPDAVAEEPHATEE
jgi:hypothetical protein